MTNPIDDYEVYDKILLAGVESPGICTFSGLPKRNEGWTIATAKGEEGGESTNNGRKPASFTVQFQIWVGDNHEDYYSTWPEFRAVLLTPVKTGDPQALGIWSPLLEPLGITSVTVDEWSEPVPSGPGGMSVAEVKFSEYFPAKEKKNSGKVNGSKGAGGGGANGGGTNPDGSPKGPDPNADLKAQVKEQTDIWNS